MKTLVYLIIINLYSFSSQAEIPITTYDVLVNQVLEAKLSAKRVLRFMTKRTHERDKRKFCHELGVLESSHEFAFALSQVDGMKETLLEIDQRLPDLLEKLSSKRLGRYCRDDDLYAPVQPFPGMPPATDENTISKNKVKGLKVFVKKLNKTLGQIKKIVAH